MKGIIPDEHGRFILCESSDSQLTLRFQLQISWGKGMTHQEIAQTSVGQDFTAVQQGGIKRRIIQHKAIEKRALKQPIMKYVTLEHGTFEQSVVKQENCKSATLTSRYMLWLVVFMLFGDNFWGIKGSFAATQAPAIQLATDWKGPAGIDISAYLISEKLDGVRGYWDGQRMLTRQGYPIAVPAWFVQDFPEYSLDGEFWLGRGQFEAISGLVRQVSPDEAAWRKVRFMVFDVPSQGDVFAKRYAFALAHLSSQSVFMTVIPQYRVDNMTALQQKLDEAIGDGAEGLMLHHSQARYQVGRNPQLIKLKPVYDAEAKVIGHIPGKGQFTGKLGALRVETPDGRVFNLGTGFTVAQRQAPPDIGTIVTYQYNGLTVNGLPRFARFMRVRSDVQ